MKVNQLVKVPFSFKAIYELRKTSILLTVSMMLVIGALHFIPFTVTFMGLEPYMRHLEQSWQLTAEEKQLFIAGLPQGCGIQNQELTCRAETIHQVRDDFYVTVNTPTKEMTNGIQFKPKDFQLVINGHVQTFSYFHLEGLTFSQLQESEFGFSLLFHQLARPLQGALIVPFVLGSYVTGMISYLSYILAVSALSMLLKFGRSSFLKYKEVLNILVFSSLLPTLLALSLGFVTPAFTTLIVNLLTPIIAFFVYRKHVAPGLNDPLDEKENFNKGVACL